MSTEATTGSTTSSGLTLRDLLRQGFSSRWYSSSQRSSLRLPPNVHDSSDKLATDVEDPYYFVAGGMVNGSGGREFVEIGMDDHVVDHQEKSVHLTWEDLCVTATNGKGGGGALKKILQEVTGYAQPGEMLCIMGPSGCGKSTLLDALAGRLGANTRQAGKILVNGKKQNLGYGTSAYVTQDDTLIATLTVREAVYYSAQLQLPSSMTKAEKMERADRTIREMGLQDAVNTRIGGPGAKGSSGGQRRRVSICIEILTRPKLLFLDEPTSGLDSAASYHVMRRIVGLAKHHKRTVIASIHQPSSEVFELFQNLCLLSAGRTVYFGPASDARDFFSSCGFPCPTLRNPSDHYLRTINSDFDQEFGDDRLKAPKSNKTAEAIETLVTSYSLSPAARQVLQKVAELNEIEGGHIVKKGSQSSFMTQASVLTRRSFVNMYRDLGYYWLRLAIYIGLALCIGTIYIDIGINDLKSAQDRTSMVMFIASFITFMAIGGFPSFVKDMRVFALERQNGHYGVAAFVIGNTISSIPYLLIVSLIPGAIAYYLVRHVDGVDHFFYFALVLFVCMMLVESLMMMVASLVSDFLMGIVTGAGLQGMMMLNGGYFRLPRDLPKPFWKYPMYYIAFHKYANQAFVKNEFMGTRYIDYSNGLPGRIVPGEEILSERLQVEMGYSKWVDLAILFGMVIFYRVMFFLILKLTERLKPMVRSVLARMHNRKAQVLDTVTPPIRSPASLDFHGQK